MADSVWLRKVSKEFDDILKDRNTCNESQVRITEKINVGIMENKLSATDWSLNPHAWDLYWFVDLFQAEFFKDTPVPTPALTSALTHMEDSCGAPSSMESLSMRYRTFL